MNAGLQRHSHSSLLSFTLAGVLLLTATAGGLIGCQFMPTHADTETTSVASGEDNDHEVLTANQNTSLKTSTLQSVGLGGGEICPIPEGTILSAESLRAEGIDHWRVTGLFELKLPSGEIARRQRISDENPNPGSSSATKTPAELLNCKLLEQSSFLVYSKHFVRAKASEPAGNQSSQVNVKDAVSQADAHDDNQFQWPTVGRSIRNDAGGSGYFNAPRASGHGHQGIDIVSSVGSPVYAIRSGTIIDPSWEEAYGKVLDVSHAGGFLSRYAHLSSFSYSHGSYVQKGGKIAASGRTGNASGSGITPHLHFEIRQYGRPLNPLNVLPR